MDGIDGIDGMGSYPLDYHFCTRGPGVLVKYCLFTTNGSKITKMSDCVEKQHRQTGQEQGLYERLLILISKQERGRRVLVISNGEVEKGSS